MKKAGKVAIAITIIIVILGACVLADYLVNGSIIDRLNGLLNGQNQQQDVVDEIQKVTDEINEEKSEENKQQYEDYENNKIKSEDIIIPEDAPEDVKEELQQKILYFKVLENIERIYSNSHTPINTSNPENNSSSITGIKDFVFDRIDQETFKYFCVVDTVNYANGKYFKSISVLTFRTNAIYRKIEDLNEFLSGVKSAQENHVFYHSEKCNEIGTKIFSDIMKENYRGAGDWSDEINIVACCEERTNDEYNMKYLIKQKYSDFFSYQIMNVSLTWKEKGKTEEEFKNYVMNNNLSYNYNVSEIWNCSDINWDETLQEFLDSGVA